MQNKTQAINNMTINQGLELSSDFIQTSTQNDGENELDQKQNQIDQLKEKIYFQELKLNSICSHQNDIMLKNGDYSEIVLKTKKRGRKPCPLYVVDSNLKKGHLKNLKQRNCSKKYRIKNNYSIELKNELVELYEKSNKLLTVEISWMNHLLDQIKKCLIEKNEFEDENYLINCTDDKFSEYLDTLTIFQNDNSLAIQKKKQRIAQIAKELKDFVCLISSIQSNKQEKLEGFNIPCSGKTNEELLKDIYDLASLDDAFTCKSAIETESNAREDFLNENLFKESKFAEATSNCGNSKTFSTWEETHEVIYNGTTYPSLYQRFKQPEAIVITINQTEWLSDSHIDSFLTLLKISFTEFNESLKHPGELAFNSFKPKTLNKSIYVIHLEDHWVTIFYENENGKLFYYDSYSDLKKYELPRFKIIKENFIPANQEEERVKVQQQTNEYDCGVFSLAFATSLCYGDDPGKIEYDPKQLRNHYNECITERKVLRFPVKEGFKIT